MMCRSKLETNIRDHEVWCPRCKKYSKTNQPAPVCKNCGATLITVLYSIMTGQRITGEELIYKVANLVKDELAPRIS